MVIVSTISNRQASTMVLLVQVLSSYVQRRGYIIPQSGLVPAFQLSFFKFRQGRKICSLRKAMTFKDVGESWKMMVAMKTPRNSSGAPIDNNLSLLEGIAERWMTKNGIVYNEQLKA